MTIEAIPMAKQTKQETVENDLGTELKSSKIVSEIDFLKKMKLKAKLASSAGTDDAGKALKRIAEFQSEDDLRIQEVYSKLIVKYQQAETEKKRAVTNPGEARTFRNEMANIYAQFGYKDLYQIAAIVAEIQRVKQENEDIMSTVKGI
jgi:phosphomannomutase